MSDNIKLVIEIPKIDKELLDNDCCGETRKEAILFSVKNSTPLSEVLDEIKGEFIERYPKNYMGEPELNGCSCAFSLNKVLEIIDKHISGEGDKK